MCASGQVLFFMGSVYNMLSNIKFFMVLHVVYIRGFWLVAVSLGKLESWGQCGKQEHIYRILRELSQCSYPSIWPRSQAPPSFLLLAIRKSGESLVSFLT